MATKQTELKIVDVMSAGKISTILMAIIGGIIGILYGIFFIGLGAVMNASGDIEGTSMIVMGIIFLVASIPGYALLGFVMGVLYACLYNIIARKWGGLKFELK